MARTLDLRFVAVKPGDEVAVKADIDLGNRSRATLGLMPFSAYKDAAEEGTLVVFYLGDRAVGYALYAVARNRVRLAHLCVDHDFRGRRIARHLITYISQRHAGHLGIAARCRESYNLGGTWIKLGFTRVHERPGKSKSGAVLVDWWLDHGHGHLFIPDPETVLVRAAIDTDVLRSMVEDGPDSEECRALLEDHLAGLLELVRTTALEVDIEEAPAARRKALTRQAQPFTAVRPDPDRQVHLAHEIRDRLADGDPDYAHAADDQKRVQQVADAVAADLNVLISCDDVFRRSFGPVVESYGLRILRPADLISHIDELARAESYRPVELLNTAFTQRLIGAGDEAALASLTSGSAEAANAGLLVKMRRLALEGHDRIGIVTPDGDVAAVYATHVANGVLDVPLLFVAPGALADTLAHQLIFLLRGHARAAGAAVIRISDRPLGSAVRIAASHDGFHAANGSLHGYAISAVGPAAEIQQHATAAYKHAGLPASGPLSSGMPAIAAAELERIWWLVKITDSALPSYLVPIRQAYSTDLLGIPSGIVPRHDGLGLAREHVYYRSAAGIRLEYPARLLWYMSEGGSATPEPAAVIACSHLDEVVTGSPDELYARYQHLGVWPKAARWGRGREFRSQLR